MNRFHAFTALAALALCSCAPEVAVPVKLEAGAADPLHLHHVKARSDRDGVLVSGQADGPRLGYAHRGGVVITLDAGSEMPFQQRCVEEPISRRKDPVGSFAVRFMNVPPEQVRGVTVDVRAECPKLSRLPN